MKRTIIIAIAAVLLIGIALAYGGRQNANPRAMAGAGSSVMARTLHDEAASLLGIPSDELVVLHQSKTLAVIAEEANVDLAAFTADLITARNASVEQALTDGLITEAQASMMTTRTEAVVEAMLTREVGPNAGFANGANFGRMFGAHQGRAMRPADSPQGNGYRMGVNKPAGNQHGRAFNNAMRSQNCEPQFQGPAWSR